MADQPYALGIDPTDAPYYRSVIRREKSLTQSDQGERPLPGGVYCVMVVSPPSGWVAGQCVILRQDPRFPFGIELSVNGYPGFGVLETIRGRYGTEEFSFPRDASNEQVRAAFPASVRNRMVVTGGTITVLTDTIQNPAWGKGSPSSIPRYIRGEVTVNTGRFFLGFIDEPDIAFAQTDEPTAAQLLALGAIIDDYGFSTNGDSRVTVRFREVDFLCSELTVPFRTLVDTSVPSPIASGALAYAANVSGMGLSVLSVEPRVYQELSEVFDLSVSFS